MNQSQSQQISAASGEVRLSTPEKGRRCCARLMFGQGAARLVGLSLLLVLLAFPAQPILARSDTQGTAPLSGNSAVAILEREHLPLGPAPQADRSTARSGQPKSSEGGWIMQTVFALGGVLALALLGGVAVRMVAARHGGLRVSLGAGGRSPSGIIEVIGRYPIARGSSLVLLKIDRRILLLSQTSQGRLGAGAAFTTLCEIDDPEEIASILVKARDNDGDSMAERFRGILSRADRGFETEADDAPDDRRRSINAGSDRAELWNAARADIPLVDLTRDRSPNQSGGPISSLRQRLAALRTQGGRA